MKRRILALACAVTMVLGMSMTVFASPSPATGETKNANKIVTASNQQPFASSTIASFPSVTRTNIVGLEVTAVTDAEADELVREAVNDFGMNAFIATMVRLELTYRNDHGPFRVTLYNGNIWAGQQVEIIHKVSIDGNNYRFERIPAESVANGSVTFVTNSFSPFAVVINTAGGTVPAVAGTSPKTMDIALMVSGFAGLFTAGAALTRKKEH